jgi:hypothetical protein
MGYNPQTCYDTLTAKGLVPICDHLKSAPYHCDDLVQIDPVMHKSCADAATYYFPIPTLACVKVVNGNVEDYRYFPPDDAFDDCDALGKPWKMKRCYCCCSCFAYGTKIGVPEGVRAVETIARGEEVLAGYREGENVIGWKPVPVTFSDGAGQQVSHATLYLSFGPEDEPPTGELICSGDQPLMLADGSMTIAKKLRQGESLMGYDGKPVALRSVAFGEYDGGVHHLGIGAKRTGDDGSVLIDGHLLIAGGVVAGDYYLQLYFEQVEDDHKADDHDDRPEIGTSEYADAHGDQGTTAAVVFGDTPGDGAHAVDTQTGRFTFFTAPAERQRHVAYFTTEQAENVLANGEQMPLSNGMPKAWVDHIFNALRGFYPDLTYYVDWYDMLPNVYAIEAYGEKIVSITGGMARLVGLSYEGLAMMIAHGIMRFSALPPRGVEGLTGTGAADYYALGLVSRALWNGDAWTDQGTAAIHQIDAVFKLAGADGGSPVDPVNQPSLACRLKGMKSAFVGGALPECAGGTPPPKLALETVVATQAKVDLTLSLPPTAETAKDVANYSIEPAVHVSSATIDPRSNFFVTLDAELETGTDYQLTIHGLRSILGTGTDPANDRKNFQVGIGA